MSSRRLKFMACALVAGLALAGPSACSGGQDRATAQAAVAKGALLLDVRTPDEFAAGHLDGAVNIPVDDLARRLGEVPREREIVVYCRSGRRSAAAAEVLRGRGQAVIDLGAMSNW